MDSLTHMPSEEWDLRTKTPISHKCLIYRRRRLIFWSMNICQESLLVFKPRTACVESGWIVSSLHPLPKNTAHPKPSMGLPIAVARISPIAIPLLFPNKFHFWSFELGSVYLFIEVDTIISNIYLRWRWYLCRKVCEKWKMNHFVILFQLQIIKLHSNISCHVVVRV